MKKKMRKGQFMTVGIFFAVLFIVAGSWRNTAEFGKMLDQVAEKYVSDNNQQLAAHIRMPEILLTEDLVQRKKQAMELDELLVISGKNDIFSKEQDILEIIRWLDEHPKAQKRPEISYLQDQSIIFTAPVIKEGVTEEIVVGMQSYENIQALVNENNYQGMGVSLLLNMEKRERIVAEGNSSLSVSPREISTLFDRAEKMQGTHTVYLERFPDGKSKSLHGCLWFAVSDCRASLYCSDPQPEKGKSKKRKTVFY